MKKSSLLFIPILLLQFVIANAQIDKRAKDLLDKVSAKTRSYTSYKITFSFTLENPQLNTNETTEGTLSVKGPKYFLKMGPQEIYCDGKNVVSYQVGTKEAMQQDVADMDTESITPQSIFMMYEKGFKIRYVKDVSEKEKVSLAVIDLYPMDPKNKDYTMITLFVNNAAFDISRAEIKAKNGSKYTYTVSKLEPNIALTDNQFVFPTAKYPAVKIVK